MTNLKYLSSNYGGNKNQILVGTAKDFRMITTTMMMMMHFYSLVSFWVRIFNFCRFLLKTQLNREKHPFYTSLFLQLLPFRNIKEQSIFIWPNRPNSTTKRYSADKQTICTSKRTKKKSSSWTVVDKGVVFIDECFPLSSSSSQSYSFP